MYQTIEQVPAYYMKCSKHFDFAIYEWPPSIILSYRWLFTGICRNKTIKWTETRNGRSSDKREENGEENHYK